MKSLIIYHDNCTDGFGAALAAWLKLKHEVDYLPRSHYDPVPTDLSAYDHIYFLDFCFPKAVIAQLLETHQVTIIDHHKSVWQELHDFTHSQLTFIFNEQKSGVELAWNHWFPGQPLPELFEHIRNRDLNRLSLVTEKIIAALMTYPKQFLIWEKLLNTSTQQLLIEGETVFRTRNQMIEEMLTKIHWAQIAGHWVPAVNATVWWNDLTKELLKRFPQVPFVAAYYQIDGVRIKWSLRSPEGQGCDVGQLSQNYGGGGHAHTGGFVSRIQDISLLTTAPPQRQIA